MQAACKVKTSSFIIVADHSQYDGVIRLADGRGQCTVCGKVSSLYHNVVQHYRLLHTEGERERCHVCGLDFKNKISLGGHMRRKHGLYPSVLKDSVVHKPV